MNNRILDMHKLENWAQISEVPIYAVLYAGDTATGTDDEWQVWTQEQIDNA